MKYLIYSTLLFVLVARADDLLPEGTEVEANHSEEAILSEPVPPSEPRPSLALPVESPVATATAVTVSTATQTTAPEEQKAASASAEGPLETAGESAPTSPIDLTAQQPVPPPVALPQIDYGPSAEEGYGSVGLKNEGQFMEVGGDKRTEESPTEGDRKTSSLPEDITSLP